MKFEWNAHELTDDEKAEIEEFVRRAEELGLDNAFFDEEALVFIDGTHLPIPEKVRVIRE